MTLSLLLVPLDTVKKSQQQEKRKQLQKSFLLKQSLHTNKIIGENNSYCSSWSKSEKKKPQKISQVQPKNPFILAKFARYHTRKESERQVSAEKKCRAALEITMRCEENTAGRESKSGPFFCAFLSPTTQKHLQRCYFFGSPPTKRTS